MVALESSTTKTFLGWAVSQGIETPLNLSHRAGFGRYTTCRVEHISPNDDILRIPISACIKSDTLESLAERLSYERNKEAASIWAPYINVLPKLDDFRSTLPRFWDTKRLETITDGGQLEARMIKDDRKGIDPWALACVDSRANYLGENYAMTPMLDMISHDGSVSTRAKVKEEPGLSSVGQGGLLCLTSGRSYFHGEEVYISYGNLSNLDTLADYGFVTKDNPCNSETINIQMMRKPPFTITINADGTIDQGAEATLRWYFANEDELSIFTSLENGSGLGILSKPLSARNELDVQSFIASTLDEAAYNANSGAAEIRDDATVRLYLSERSNLLYSGIEKIKAKYPDMEY